MNFVDLDNNPIEVNITNKLLHRHKTKFSKLHIKGRKLLQSVYPLHSIYEDVPIYVYDNKLLYLDLFIPELNLTVEVNGEQHYNFNCFFYKNKLDFAVAINNDRLKRQWCKLNKLKLIEFPYDESEEKWKERLNAN